jgi:hypothetical protein
MGRAEEPVDAEQMDPGLKQALGDFKASVRAWSEAAYNRPRAFSEAVVRRSWRLVWGWSLTVVLLAGTVSGGFYEHHRALVLAELTAEHNAQQQRQLAFQHEQELAQQEEETLASVDGDVSREVPSAMEPLAQLGDESQSQ